MCRLVRYTSRIPFGTQSIISPILLDHQVALNEALRRYGIGWMAHILPRRPTAIVCGNKGSDCSVVRAILCHDFISAIYVGKLIVK